MKWPFIRSIIIKTLLLAALVLLVPYFAPFAIEFILLIDFVGLEALIVLLFAYSKTVMRTQIAQLQLIKEDIKATFALIAQLYVFKPRVYFLHATASSALVMVACSVFLACAVWVPVICISAGSIS